MKKFASATILLAAAGAAIAVSNGDFNGTRSADLLIRRGDRFLLFHTRGSVQAPFSTYGNGGSLTLGSAQADCFWGDFDGDGRGDPAVRNPSTGQITYRSSVSNLNVSVSLPAGDATAFSADFNGDRLDDIGVLDSNGLWTIRFSGIGTVVTRQDSRPIPGFSTYARPADTDGDGRAELVRVIVTASNNSGNISTSFLFGKLDQPFWTGTVGWSLAGATAEPLMVDLNADGRADPVMYTPTTSTFTYSLINRDGRSIQPLSIQQTAWGRRGSRPLIADVDGDSIVNFCTYGGADADGNWRIKTTGPLTQQIRHAEPIAGGVRVTWGQQQGDRPVYRWTR